MGSRQSAERNRWQELALSTSLFNTHCLALTTGATFQTELAARDALEGRSKGVRALLPFVGPALIASMDAI